MVVVEVEAPKSARRRLRIDSDSMSATLAASARDSCGLARRINGRSQFQQTSECNLGTAAEQSSRAKCARSLPPTFSFSFCAKRRSADCGTQLISRPLAVGRLQAHWWRQANASRSARKRASSAAALRLFTWPPMRPNRAGAE